MSKKVKIVIIGIIIVLIGISSAIYIVIKHQSNKETNTPSAVETPQTNMPTIIQSEETNDEKEKYVNILENGSKLNTSQKLKESKEFEGILITDIQLTQNNGITKLTANLQNKTNEIKEAQVVEISFIDENNNELATMDTYIKKIAPDETAKLNASITFDYANAYNFTIKKKY